MRRPPPSLRTRLLALGLPLLLSACATQWHSTDAGLPRLALQDAALTPGNGGRQALPADLQAGDILLSSGPGLNAIGIRLSTLSPVSHAALYLGDGRVVDAVGSGVRELPLHAFIDEADAVVAFRHPGLQDGHLPPLADFARAQVGQPYNLAGVMLQAPFALERRVCELPLLPGPVRDFCLRGIALVQLGAGPNDRFFCSQLVLEAYKRAGLPLTDADPRLATPADLLHMREGDVPSVRTHQALRYVGHLKLPPEPTPGVERIAENSH
ncbi:YaeF family permuted papain-like enzyme [Comamonas humi]